MPIFMSLCLYTILLFPPCLLLLVFYQASDQWAKSFTTTQEFYTVYIYYSHFSLVGYTHVKSVWAHIQFDAAA